MDYRKGSLEKENTMIKKGLLTDKQKLIQALEREIGERATYNGAPTFSYKVGACTVLRDGSLKTEDEELCKKLAAEGLIEGDEEKSPVSFPVTDFRGKHLVNLVNLLSVKGALINKAIGKPGAFQINPDLVEMVKEVRPADLREFMDCIYACGGEKAMKGIRISRERIEFPAFTEEYRPFAELIIRTSLKQNWSKHKDYNPVNEKYYFRGWLNFIGMKGEKYRAMRERLLSNLEGDGSFRTPEQKKKFYERTRERRKAIQPEFVAL